MCLKYYPSVWIIIHVFEILSYYPKILPKGRREFQQLIKDGFDR